jgi:hypothetical protein
MMTCFADCGNSIGNFFGGSMSILASVCLLGISCRHDGGNCLSVEAMKLVGCEHVVPIRSEQLGDLSTPRPPAEFTAAKGRMCWPAVSRSSPAMASTSPGSSLRELRQPPRQPGY